MRGYGAKGEWGRGGVKTWTTPHGAIVVVYYRKGAISYTALQGFKNLTMLWDCLLPYGLRYVVVLSIRVLLLSNTPAVGSIAFLAVLLGGIAWQHCTTRATLHCSAFNVGSIA